MRIWFTVAVRIGCSSRALTASMYEMSAPCVPDHRWMGWREWFRFFIERRDDYLYVGVLDQADYVESRLKQGAELLEFTMEPVTPVIAALAA